MAKSYLNKIKEGVEENRSEVLSKMGLLPGARVLKIEVIQYKEPDRRPYDKFIGQVRVNDTIASQVALATKYDKKHPRVDGLQVTGEVIVDEPWDRVRDADYALIGQGGAKRRVTLG